MLITLKQKIAPIFQIPILITLITMVAGCDREEEELFIDLKAPITLKCNGNTEELSQFARDNLKNFFSNNTKGWRKTPVSYTRKVILVSENFTVQVVDNAVVVNSYESQYVKKIEENSFFKKLCQ